VARTIAKEASVFGYPMVEAYRRLHAWFVDEQNPLYLAPWNTLVDLADGATADGGAGCCPDTDILLSVIGLDLRSEPMVLTVPPMGAGRHFRAQCLDAYTHNFAHFGSGGNFLIAGPDWAGEAPANISQSTRSETALGLVFFRTQVMNVADRADAEQLRQGCRVQSLSAFLRQPPPPPSKTAIALVKPSAPGGAGAGTATELFRVLSALLALCAVHPSETALMRRFARIGLRAGVPFAAQARSPELQAALERGMADAWLELAALQHRVELREFAPACLYGSRQSLGNDYLLRMAGAIQAPFGDSAPEQMCWTYRHDADGGLLLGASRYTLHFASGRLPPVHAFWSLTICKASLAMPMSSSLGARALNSSMEPGLARDADGGVTLHIQQTSPGVGREANWLPTPAGPFAVTLRLYRPRPEALEGQWCEPAIFRVPAQPPADVAGTTSTE
jgi:hypothetical protein